MNADAKVLEPLSNSGRTVSIQGRLPMGADALFIEKIDGKPYSGKRGAPYPAVKGAPNK